MQGIFSAIIYLKQTMFPECVM